MPDEDNVPEYRKPLTHRLDRRFFDSIVLDEPKTPPNPQKVLSGPQKGRERGDKNSGRDRRFEGPRHPKERRNMEQEQVSRSPNGQPVVQTPTSQLVQHTSPIGQAVLGTLAVGAAGGIIVFCTYAGCMTFRKFALGM